MIFSVEGYRTKNGDEPYAQAMDAFFSISPKLFDKVVLWADHIRDDQYHHMPYSESVGDGIFALRVQHGRHFARLFFVKTAGRQIWLLNGYYKSSNKIPPSELERARRLYKELINKGGSP